MHNLKLWDKLEDNSFKIEVWEQNRRLPKVQGLIVQYYQNWATMALLLVSREAWSSRSMKTGAFDPTSSTQLSVNLSWSMVISYQLVSFQTTDRWHCVLLDSSSSTPPDDSRALTTWTERRHSYGGSGERLYWTATEPINETHSMWLQQKNPSMKTTEKERFSPEKKTADKRD